MRETNNVAIKSKFRAKDMVLVAIFSTLIWLGSVITVPVMTVPITLQVLFTNLAGLILGSKRGAASVLVYILLGLIGIPVFAGGAGGIATVIKPTFGYIIGFLAGTFVAGKISEKDGNNSLIKYLLAGVVNVLIVYIIGTGYMYMIVNFYIGKTMSVTDAIVQGMLIFLPIDMVKIFISALLLKRIHPFIKSSIE